jgi:glycosyltransferase involved in cell wall biosynthesis
MIPARVALLTNFIPPYRESLFRAIGSRVGELRVFLASPSARKPEQPGTEGFDVTIQKQFSMRRPRVHPVGFTDTTDVVVPFDTRRQLAEYQPDVVISGECGFRSLQSAVYCLRHTRCRLVLWATLSEHTEVGRGRLRQVARRWLFRRAAAVFVNGQSGRRYVEGLGCDSAKVTEVPYTVPMSAFTSRNSRPSSSQVRRLLYVGQLIERKGILPFIQNLSHFCTNNPAIPIELSIAGAGPLEQLLKSQTLGGRGTIRFLGAVPYIELPSVYADADMFVFPTLADEWGVVVNEAMASGLPVLGSVYSQAVEELVEDGVTGWVFRPDNADEVTSKLNQALAASIAQLEEMGTLAAERISEVTPEAAAEQMVNAISKILGPSTLDLRLA